MRAPTPAELCHERLGIRFDAGLSGYDTTRRVEVLIDGFLAPRLAPGATVLDVGCGLGFFSERLHQIGMSVTASDIGPTLLQRTIDRVGCAGQIADALALTETFAEGSFDAVVSSECIEHTPDPAAALRQMAAVVRPGGWLAASTPNVVWYPVVAAATLLRLRPFDGNENFSTFRGVRRTLTAAGLEVVAERGLHLFPFQLGLHGLSRWCDRRLQPVRGAMINLCVLARKPG